MTTFLSVTGQEVGVSDPVVGSTTPVQQAGLQNAGSKAVLIAREMGAHRVRGILEVATVEGVKGFKTEHQREPGYPQGEILLQGIVGAGEAGSVIGVARGITESAKRVYSNSGTPLPSLPCCGRCPNRGC